MVDQPLLSELCSICHNQTSKYRCPRCSARTCSLECSKRHKQRAQCSGIRDPTGYVKKSQLATAAAIDHDFNFLTGLHRAIDSGAEAVEERGIGTADQSDKRRRYGEQHSFRARVAETRVIIDRAPEGMSRQRMNMSRWNPKRKCIIWTVEWIHEDGSREVTGGHNGVFDNVPLSEAYHALCESKNKKRKRGPPVLDEHGARATSNTEGVTRSEIPAPLESTVPNSKDPAQLGLTLIANDAPVNQAGAAYDDNPAPLPEQVVAPDAQAIGEPPDNSTSDIPVEAEPGRSSSNVYIKLEPANPPRQAANVFTKPETPETPIHHFYLVKPHTSSFRPVLIPVASAQTLSECLREQVVLEFPTIQVLSQAPESLPDRFMLESEYLNHFRAEERELDELMAHVKEPLREDGGQGGMEEKEEVPQDMKMIAEMLQMDVGGRS